MHPKPEGSKAGLPVFILTGGTGMSGEQVARTVGAQFEGEGIEVRVFPKLVQASQVREVLDLAAVENAVVLHTFVDSGLRKKAAAHADSLGLEALDLFGPLIETLAGRLQQTPRGAPGLYRQLHKSYFDRIDAINYTMAHDDGKNHEGWGEAEIMIVGPSRAGKTPLCLYLSMLGWKAANLPLVPGIPVRGELFELDHRRVFGLVMSPAELIRHREHRQKALGVSGAGSDYIDPVEVAEELEEVDSIIRRGGFKRVDTTSKPIESSANEIIRALKVKLKLS